MHVARGEDGCPQITSPLNRAEEAILGVLATHIEADVDTRQEMLLKVMARGVYESVYPVIRSILTFTPGAVTPEKSVAMRAAAHIERRHGMSVEDMKTKILEQADTLRRQDDTIKKMGTERGEMSSILGQRDAQIRDLEDQVAKLESSLFSLHNRGLRETILDKLSERIWG